MTDTAIDRQTWPGYRCARCGGENEQERLRAQLAEAREFIEFCDSLTGSMWPQNETTDRLAQALRQSPIVKALAGKESE